MVADEDARGADRFGCSRDHRGSRLGVGQVGAELTEPRAGRLGGAELGEDGVQIVPTPGQRTVVRREMVHEQVGAQFGKTVRYAEADPATA